jgi:hypothetical protein
LAEQRVASERLRLLSLLVATFLLFVVTAPVASSKLESLWSSEFTFRPDTYDPICIPAGPCFRLTNAGMERTSSGQSIPLRMIGVNNVYEIVKDMDDGNLKSIVTGGSGTTIRSEIQSQSNLYFNMDEDVREAQASLHFPDAPPVGKITLAFERAGAVSAPRTLEIAQRDMGDLESFLVGAGQPDQFRRGASLLILLLAAVTCWLEARSSRGLAFGTGAFAAAVLLRWAMITAAGAITSPLFYLLTIFAIMLPWMPLALRVWSPRMGAKLIVPLCQIRRWNERPSAIELVMLVLSVGVFAYMLWFGSSFRWSIFEERDFLEARRVLSELTIPIYGPELLLGGHTIGGGLYLLLAPVVALWNDPAALLLLNRLLFLGMALVLWWGIRPWVGPAGALFAVFALIASERIVALSYWPIHPNFSLFFALLYAAAVLRGAVDGHRAWLIFSGLLLGGLVQLHFSYFLLVPCHVIIVLLANYDRDRWTKPLAAASFLLPLAPFLIIDAIHDFSNIAQIAQRPRFHSLYPSKILGNADLMPLVFGWFRQIGGSFSGVLSTLTLMLTALGIAIGIASLAAPARSLMTAPLAAAVLFTIPAFELTVLGMGYNTRHTLTMVPSLFILAGFGFAGAVNLTRLNPRWAAPLVVLPLLAVLGARASNSAVMNRMVNSEGEWAVDYKSRKAIATDLAIRLGLSPQAYPTRTYWWWVGWSIDPTVYAETYRHVVGSVAAPKSALAPDQYVLITAAAELPAFLKNIFDDNGSRPVGGMHVHVATPKAGASLILPSSNADTGVRLNPFLEQVDGLRRQPPGFSRIGHAQGANERRDLFLGTMAEGRIKLLVTTVQSEIAGRSRLRWCVDSPSLNGHYQEIKTIWRPQLLLIPEFGTTVEANLASDVLGSLAYKAPRCGEAWSDRIGSWQMTFAIEGFFDQSFMPRPDFAQRRWPLDFATPIRNSSLSPTAIAGWIEARFDR